MCGILIGSQSQLRWGLEGAPEFKLTFAIAFDMSGETLVAMDRIPRPN